MFTANLLLGYTIYCLPQIPDRIIVIMLLNSCVLCNFLVLFLLVWYQLPILCAKNITESNY